ncbi:MAG: CBS domain-containing protein [Polyangiaceae bacterium]
MSLERFLPARVVVQSPDTRLYDAVRAMQDNNIGAVLVHDGQSLVGVVTDRDLGLKLAELELDPFESQLVDVMTSPVVSIGRDASVVDVAALMIASNVRRIPIVDGDMILGLVTLDDLILEHAVDAFTLAAIVLAQLAAPTKLKAAGRVRPGSGGASASERATRHEVRQGQAYVALLKRTMDSTGLTSRDEAERALNTVLSGLLRRVTAEEAGDLLAQLPSRLREYALRLVVSGSQQAVSRGFIERALAASLDVGPERAGRIAAQVAHVLEQSVSAGEMAQFKGRLPSDLRELFDASVYGAAQPH